MSTIFSFILWPFICLLSQLYSDFFKKNQNISESSNLKYNNQEWYTHPKLLAFQVEYTPCKSDKVHEDLYTKETCMSETVAIS